MRSSFLIFLTTTLLSYRVAAECCGTNGIDRCCSDGKGNCDIFCCNCQTGCAPEETCSDNCLNLCLTGCPPPPDDPKKFKWLGQQCYVECNKQCEPDSMMRTSNEAIAITVARRVFKRGTIMSDEAIFNEVDEEGKGYISYDQFLQRQGWQDSAGARAHFDRHDVDGDGVIRIGEMRINSDL